MKHIPNKIYLQIGEDCDAEDFKDLNEVTWCQVEIHSNDIEYVRSSQQPSGDVLEALEALINSLPMCIEDSYKITTHHPSGGSATMGPNSLRRFKQAIKQAESILAKHRGKNIEWVVR